MSKPTAAAPKRTRQTRTPAQKAQDALDVIDRQILAVKKRIDAKAIELKDVENELAPLERRREYAAMNPDLQSQVSGQAAVASGLPADDSD